jgi:hypothetical protein
MQYTTTQPKIRAITQQPVLNKKAFVASLAIFGVFDLLAGLINLVTAIILFSNASPPSLASSTLIDAIYKLSLGALILASSAAFVKGKLLSVWLYAGAMLVGNLYSLFMGYPLNYVFLGFGLLLIWQVWKNRNQLELK